MTGTVLDRLRDRDPRLGARDPGRPPASAPAGRTDARSGAAATSTARRSPSTGVASARGADGRSPSYRRQAVGAGVVSAPVALRAQVAGVAARPPTARDVTVTSSSPTGRSRRARPGCSSDVLLQLSPERSRHRQLYYQDATAGAVTLTASAAWRCRGDAAAHRDGRRHRCRCGSTRRRRRSCPARRRPSPRSASTGFGNETPTSAVWALTPPTLGTLDPASGSTTTIAAGSRPGVGQLTATVTTPAGPLTATTTVTVTAPPVARVAGCPLAASQQRRLHVYVTVVDARGDGCATQP